MRVPGHDPSRQIRGSCLWYLSAAPSVQCLQSLRLQRTSFDRSTGPLHRGLTEYVKGLLLGLVLALIPMTARAETMFVTAYNLIGFTSSGVYTHVGSAACPPDLPFFTRIHLSGKIEVDAVCEDSYAPWLSRRVDVWMPSYRMAIATTGWYEMTILPAEDEDN